MQSLKDLPAPLLKTIAKLATDAMKGRRDELGQVKGEFAVDQTVVLHAKGIVKVSKSTPDAIVAQSAKPWSIVHTLLTELNTEREAAGKVGIDIAKVVEMAESADPDLVKAAKEAADAHVREIKEEVRQFKWGSTSPKATVEVLAVGDHLAQASGE
jgi:hypothetical protein